MRNSWRTKLKVWLYTSDAASVVFAFFTSYFLRNVGPFRFFLEAVQPIEVYLAALPFAVVLFLATFYAFGLYDPTKRIKPFGESYLATKAVVFWTLLIMAGSYLYKYDYSRIIVLLTFFLTLVFTNLGRTFIRKIEQSYYKKGLGLLRILIIGAGRPGRDLARRLREYSSVGHKVVGFLDDKAENRKNFPVIGKLKDFERIIKKKNIHEVYVADPTLSHKTILGLMARCPEPNVRFRVASNVFDLVSGAIDIAHLESIPSLDLWRAKGPFWSGAPKRVFDITFTLTMFLLTAPLWVVIALAIYLTDGAPAILAQKRVGLGGKEFKIYKFRTMKKGTARYAEPPIDSGDKRITKVGRWLRKTSLDELPQLVNILKGEMSLVGPRPEMPHKVAKYEDWQRKRLEVKPGLTGLWQVLGRKDLPLNENLEYDFYYISNQSFFLDMMIILKTIPIVLTGKGAY